MSLSIGQQLKTTRIDRNLSLEDVFENTHIRIKYIEALEADDFSTMPSPVQGRGFLRLYAQYLGLDAKAILAEIQQQEKQAAEFAKIEETFGRIPETIARREPVLVREAIETKATPLWQQFLARFGVTLASPELAPVQEAESAPLAEVSPISAPEPQPKIKHLHAMEEAIKVAPSDPLEESRILFAKVGASLRERREMLSLTFAEIEGHIHLRPHYMAALEAGDFEALPSPAQTRGMLTNYADFLDLDSEALLLQFAEGLQAQRVERNIAAPNVEAGKRKRRKFLLGGFIAPDLIFGGGVIVLMIGFTVWGLGRIANSRVEDVLLEATAPSIAEVLMSTATPEIAQEVTPTLVVINTPGGEIGTEAPLDENLDEGANLGVQILVTVLERSWMRVIVDGEQVFEGRAQTNATFVYDGNESVEVLTANGAGLRIAYNQRDLGLMGGFGEVVQQLYGPRGLLTPTVTPTSNATATYTPTVTPSPTATPTLDVPSTE